MNREVKGEHKDEGKPRLELIYPQFLEAMGSVLGFGATKYSANNWKNGIEYSRLIGSAMRHITAFNRGEDMDPESGLSHLAHAGCCVMMLYGMTQINKDMDDRDRQIGAGESNVNWSVSTAPIAFYSNFPRVFDSASIRGGLGT